MPEIDLTEHETSQHALSAAERDMLLGAAKSLDLAIAPVMGSDGVYSLRPGSTVGAVEIGDLSVLIRPKIGIPQLISLACYAIGMVRFRETDFDYPEEPALPDALALAFTSAAQGAFSRGLLHDYRTWEETLYGVRGRIRFADQIRRRPGSAPSNTGRSCARRISGCRPAWTPNALRWWSSRGRTCRRWSSAG